MMKTFGRVASVALLVASAGCKKDKKAGGKADKAEKAEKTAEKVDDKTPPAVEKPKLDTIEDRVAFYRACYGHLNAKDWDKFGTCFADGLVSENAGMPPVNGRDEVLKHLKLVAEAFPDFEVTPTLVLAGGNYVGSVAVFTGTHSGPMKMPGHEMPATNKKVGFEQWHMVEIDPATGGAVKEWIVTDHATLMGQLGMNPAPHRAAIDKPAGEPTVVIAGGDDAEKANAATYQAIAVDAFNKHDVKAVMAGYAPTAKIDDRTMPAEMDSKGMEKMFKEFFKAFPDLKGEVVTSFAAGDYVVALQRATGTNTGDMPSMKIKKTGKPVTMLVAEVVKLDKGKAVEHHLFLNSMSMAQQLGLMPPAHAGGDAKPEEKKAEEEKEETP